jgi:hypothetical protein
MTDDLGPIQTPSEALLVLSGRVQGTLIPIPEDEFLLGRDASVAGRLGDDPALSRRHARIRCDSTRRWFLEDLGSTNGTFLNGSRVLAPQPITAGDVIALGGATLRVVGGVASRSEASTTTAPTVTATDSSTTADREWSWWAEEHPPGPVPASRAGTGAGPAAAHDVEPAALRQAPGAAPHERRHGRATVEGQVRGLQQRTEAYGERGSQTVWSFRLERYDAAGNRLRPVPVQMRAIAYEGALSDSDQARVTGTWKDGTLQSERIENLTTHSTVKAKSYKGVQVAMLVIFALMVSGFVFLWVQSDASFQEQTERARQEFCQQARELGGGSPPGC